MKAGDGANDVVEAAVANEPELFGGAGVAVE